MNTKTAFKLNFQQKSIVLELMKMSVLVEIRELSKWILELEKYKSILVYFDTDNGIEGIHELVENGIIEKKETKVSTNKNKAKDRIIYGLCTPLTFTFDQNKDLIVIKPSKATLIERLKQWVKQIFVIK